ncbi:hypothetical protein [Streptomyces goshikiensis]|uniref:hypothetical protein n=1 Tax=Streptomyces goshikiensis TaxID=1942 RepID=UPI00371F2759
MTTPAPQPVEPASGGPTCGLCGGPAVVHWQRRLTDDEFADHLALHQYRQDTKRLLADPQLPEPAPVPPPAPTDCTRIVHGCADHAIGIDTAAHIHAKTCTAPAVEDLPGCDCKPEAMPTPEPEPEPVQPPASWITEGG